jgi:hypothetical protein
VTPLARAAGLLCEAAADIYQDELPSVAIPFTTFEDLKEFFTTADLETKRGLVLQLLNSGASDPDGYLRALMTEELISKTTWATPTIHKEDKNELFPEFRIFFLEFLGVAEGGELPQNGSDYYEGVKQLFHNINLKLKFRAGYTGKERK